MSRIGGKDRRRRRAALERRDGARCWYCEVEFPVEDLSLSRVVPLALGGTETLANLRWICPSCATGRDTAIHQLLPAARRDPRNVPS